MPEFRRVEVTAAPYLYVERSCGTDPEAIAAAMGEAFGTLMEFITRHGIPPQGAPMALYHDYDPERMSFRAGIPVPADALKAAEGEVKADTTPAGTALHFTHIGPYATLRDDYGDLMARAEAEGLTLGAPTWEVYVDDPEEVPPERLRTDVYVALA